MDLTMTGETVKPICSVFLATFIFGMCVTRASDPGPIEVWIQLVPDGTTQTIKAEKADPNGVFWDENFGHATSGAFNGGFISTNSKSGWPFVGMGSSGELDTLAYGLYRFYEPEVSGDTLYVDFRSCNWVVESFPVGSPDLTLEYLISDNKFRCGADTECRGDPPFDNNEIVGIWQLKEEIDVSGRKVRTLVNGMKPAGYWSVIWDGKSYTGAGVGTGIYVVKMQSGDFRSTRKLMLIQ